MFMNMWIPRVVIGSFSSPVYNTIKQTLGVPHPWSFSDFDCLIKVDDAVRISQVIRSNKLKINVDYLERAMVLKSYSGEIDDMLLVRPGTAYEDLYDRVIAREKGKPQWLVPGGVSVNMDELYTLKMSHRYLKNNPHFKKTMDHIHWLRDRGAKIWSTDWLAKAEEETYSYKHPSLMRQKKDFFSGDGVNYVYDHDSIHEAMKTFDIPAYQFFADPTHEVKSSRKRFFQQDRAIQLAAVFEETTVLALERSQVLYPETDPKWSWLTALEKVCTSITSGWFREFAWENYYDVEKMYDPDYVKKFREKLSQGVVKPHSL